MTDIDDVVTALASRLTTAFAGTAIGGRVYAYGIDSGSPPFIAVLPSPSGFVMFDRTMDGVDDFALTIKVVMGSQDDRANQAELLGYLGRSGTSIYAAIAGDRTLGGTVDFVNSIQGTAYGDIEWGGVVMYGAEIQVVCS
jgi:hypothetical protein